MVRRALGQALLIVTLVFLASLASAQSAIQYVYDELGRLIAVIDLSGDTATYTYDAVGNILAINRYASSQVSIISFTPSSGVAGTVVTISGTGFSTVPSQDAVTFNGTAASVSAATVTQLTVTVPAGAATGAITVTAPGGSATSSTSFIVGTGSTAPTITSFSPGSGAAGTAVTITGTNFDTNVANDRVTFNGLGAIVSSVTSTAVNTIVPANVGSGPIVVTTPLGKATGATSFLIPPTGYTTTTTQLSGTTTLGTAISVSEPTANNMGVVTFAGTAGQFVALQAASNTMGSVTLTLFAPDGTSLTSSSSSAATFSVAPQWLPATGTYAVGVVPAVANSGSLTVTPTVVATATAPPTRPTSAVLDPANPLATSLVGLFLMNEVAGAADANLVDSQIAAFSGSSVPVWVTGQPSVLLSGGASNNSYLNAGTDLTFDRLPISKVTIVAKVRATSVANAGICEKNDNFVKDGFVFGWTSAGALRLNVETTGASMIAATNSGAVAAGQWLQLAFTWDGTSGNATATAAHLYVYGVEQAQATSQSSTGTLGYANATNQPFRIGNASFDFAGSLNGEVAYLAVYRDRILTTTELAQLDAALPITTSDMWQSITPNGASTTFTTGAPAQKAQLTFAASSGQVATVQLTNNTLQPVTVSLLKPDRTVIVSSTSSASSFSLGPSWLPVSGTYTVYIQPGAGVSGSITAAVSVTNLTPRATSSVIDPSNPLGSKLAGLFLMNEGTGTTDLDLVDNQTATFAGTSQPTWNTTDPSIVFNGGTSLASYLNAGTAITFDRLPTSKMSIVAMVYVNNIAAGGIAEKNDGNQRNGFVFGMTSTGALKFTVEKSSVNMSVATASAAISAGRWQQVALTWDGTVGTASAAHLFVNAVEQTKASANDGAGTLGYTNATNQPFRIGNAAFDFTGSFNGRIQYVVVYKDRILSTSELNQLALQLPVTTADAVTTITSGTPVTATTGTGQNAQFMFSATAGQHTSIHLTTNTIGSVTASLLAPDRTVITSVSSSASTIAVPDAWLTMTGIHTIYVQPNGGSGGSITASLNLITLPSRPSTATLNANSGLSTNLVGLFLMNEGTGTVDANVVNSHTAAFSGTSTPTWNTTDPSIAFNGGVSLNSYLDAGTDLAFDQLPTSKITVAAKVYVTTVTAGGIFEKDDGNSSAGVLFGWTSTGALKLTVEKSSTDMMAATNANAIPTGRWVQFAMTWDGTIGTAAAAHLFIDGIEQTKVTTQDGAGTIGYTNATNKPFRIGNAAFDFTGSFNGKMAYLAVYRNRILTTSELAALDAQLPIQ